MLSCLLKYFLRYKKPQKIVAKGEEHWWLQDTYIHKVRAIGSIPGLWMWTFQLLKDVNILNYYY